MFPSKKYFYTNVKLLLVALLLLLFWQN